MTPQNREEFYIRRTDFDKYNDTLAERVCIEDNGKQISFSSMFQRFNAKGAIIHIAHAPILKIENLDEPNKFFVSLRAHMELAQIPTHDSVKELQSRTRAIIDEGFNDYNF